MIQLKAQACIPLTVCTSFMRSFMSSASYSITINKSGLIAILQHQLQSFEIVDKNEELKCNINKCLQFASLDIRLMIAKPSEEKSEEKLAQLRAEKRKNKKIAHLKTFHMNITPQKYRGMHLLGNFKTKDQRNTLSDLRVSYLQHRLFLNKTVLDVGAGDGSVAIQIAIRMMPQRIVALEIDAELLTLCKRRVDRIVDNNEKYSAGSHNEIMQKTISELPLYFQEAAKKAQGKYVITPQNFLEIIPQEMKVSQDFPRNFFILNDNFFNLQAFPQYDTIICLGTIKWMHLALGDEGIQTFFNKVYDFLKPGGYFILEYSQFSSYRKKKGLSELYRENLKNNIKIDPYLKFPQLLKFYGFELAGEVEPNLDRPLKHRLQIFVKSSASQSV